jgi:hypothetical protein
MTVLACSLGGPKPQFIDANGNPYSGAKLFFYDAGSSTKQNTYTDSTGITANANPVVLGSDGRPSNQIWFTSGLTYKAVLAPSTDTDPPASPIFTVDGLTGINDVTATVDEWQASGLTPTYVNATSFTLSGDQTGTFTIGRRLKTSNTGGTIYSVITASSYNGGTLLTTVTVSNYSGTLDSGLSSVSYSILRSDNPSWPSAPLDLSTSNAGQIKFPASQNASSNANTLDDYEEGTWTPAFQNIGTGTYTTQVGTYIKIGRLVHASFHLDINAAGTASGDIIVTGLPFAATATISAIQTSSAIHGTGWTTPRAGLNMLLQPSAQTLELYYGSGGTTAPTVSHADVGTGTIVSSITYIAAS